jgi:GH15 family glucan-1,4-alpha-glucosidase
MLVPNFALFDDIHADEKNRAVNARGFAAMNLFCIDEGSSASGRYDLTVATSRIDGGERRVARFAYALNGAERLFKKNTFDDIWKRTVHYWSSKDLLTTGDETLAHLYNVSRTGLRALTARSGKRDSGFWMYNMEWVRDDVMMTLGMLHAGFLEEARTLLTKIIEKSIGPDGRTIESSRWFGYDYTEIDQNGQLLYGVWAYLCWSGDTAFVKKYWNKIRAAGDFPLQDIFRDKTARLLRNKREFWERNDSFGFEDGFELAYQFWVCMGLEKGAEVAARLGDAATATRWSGAAAELRNVMLNDPKFKLIEEGHLIKRRTRDGRWQRYAVPSNRKAMPPGSPAAVEEKPECEPDSADVYPIVFEMVDPKGDVATNTLAWLEQLWSQRWDFGGYSRYNTFSEPDPPAPWPIASLLMARAYTEAGNSEKIWRSLRWLATIHGGKSGAWFERYGPSITPPAPPVCVVGWTWSEVVMLVVHHIFGLRPELDRLTIRPRLIEGLDQLKAKFTVRGGGIELAVYRTKEKPFAVVHGKKQSLEAGALSLPYGKAGKAVTVEMHVG